MNRLFMSLLITMVGLVGMQVLGIAKYAYGMNVLWDQVSVMSCWGIAVLLMAGDWFTEKRQGQGGYQ